MKRPPRVALIFFAISFFFATVSVSSFAVVSPTRRSTKWKPSTSWVVGFAASDDNDEGNDLSTKSPSDMKESLAKAAALAASAFVAYNFAAFIVTTTTNVATGALTAVGNELAREAGNVAENLGKAAGVAIEGSKVVAPVVGKAAVAGVKAAAPVVEAASQAVSDVASPYVEDATKQLTSVTAPYVGSVTSAVDSTFVAPIRDATDSVSSAIDSTIQGAADAIDDTIRGATDSVSSAVDSTIVAPLRDATDSVGDAVDSTIKGATDSFSMTIKGVTDETAASLKEAMPF